LPGKFIEPTPASAETEFVGFLAEHW
jgi:hypothetical protein